jgi:hypothetical protein
MQDAGKMWVNDSGPLEIKRLRQTLTPTSDSFEIVTPHGNCQIEQLVNFQDEEYKIYVNQDLVDKMTTTQYAALIAHEVLYKYLREQSRETNSLRVRRAVGYVFSGGQFEESNSAPERPYWLCKHFSFDQENSQLLIVQGEDTEMDGQKMQQYQFIPKQIAGVRPIGRANERILVGLKKGQLEKMLKSKKEQPMFETIGQVSPVDYSFGYRLTTQMTKDGKPGVMVEMKSAVGTRQMGRPVHLSCEYKK